MIIQDRQLIEGRLLFIFLSHYITVHISVLNSHWSKPVNFLPGWAVCCNIPTLLQNWSASYNKKGTLKNWACFCYTIQSKIKGLIKTHTQGNKGNRKTRATAEKGEQGEQGKQEKQGNKGKRGTKGRGNKGNWGTRGTRVTRGTG